MGCVFILTLLPLLKPELPIKVTFLIIAAVGTRDMQKLEPRSCSYPTSLSIKFREIPSVRAIGGLRNTALECNHILAELLRLTASPYFLHLILCPIPWILSDFSLLNTFTKEKLWITLTMYIQLPSCTDQVIIATFLLVLNRHFKKMIATKMGERTVEIIGQECVTFTEGF